MKHCTVYYQKQSDFTAREAPTREELAAGYGVVLEIEVMDDATPDDVYHWLNMDEPPTNFVRPEGVQHTSVSVGDIGAERDRQ